MRSNKIMLWGLLVVLFAGLAVLARVVLTEGGAIPDIGVSNPNPTAPNDSDSEDSQIKLMLEGVEKSDSYEVPLEYTLTWTSTDTNNCELITDVNPISQNSAADFVVEPGMIGTQQVNSIAKMNFKISAISAPATISHTLRCQNRSVAGPDIVTQRLEFVANNLISKTKVCAFDSNFDGLIDYKDLAGFALKYHRKLKACSKDIAGNDCFIDELDLLTFESAYNVEGICN